MIKLYKIISVMQCCNGHFMLKADQFFMTLFSVPDILYGRDSAVT